LKGPGGERSVLGGVRARAPDEGVNGGLFLALDSGPRAWVRVVVHSSNSNEGGER
jgi:hypothetical protein